MPEYVTCNGVRVPTSCSLEELQGMLSKRKVRFDNEDEIIETYRIFLGTRTLEGGFPEPPKPKPPKKEKRQYRKRKVVPIELTPPKKEKRAYHKRGVVPLEPKPLKKTLGKRGPYRKRKGVA